jgi:hypothetical protein
MVQTAGKTTLSTVTPSVAFFMKRAPEPGSGKEEFAMVIGNKREE